MKILQFFKVLQKLNKKSIFVIASEVKSQVTSKVVKKLEQYYVFAQIKTIQGLPTDFVDFPQFQELLGL